MPLAKMRQRATRSKRHFRENRCLSCDSCCGCGYDLIFLLFNGLYSIHLLEFSKELSLWNKRGFFTIIPNRLRWSETQLIFMKPPLQPRLISQFIGQSNFTNLSRATSLFQEPNQWNLIIRHAAATNPTKAVSLFQEMKKCDRGHDFCDDPFIYASLIKACAKLQAFLQGKSIHCRMIRLRLDHNMQNVLNSLVSLYMGCKSLTSYAGKLFDMISEKSVVTVNCMLSGHVKNGILDDGLRLFVDMLRGCYGPNVKPNYVSFVILISSCTHIRWFRTGSMLHCFSRKLGLEYHTELGNVLIDFYAKFGIMVDASSLFRGMAGKDLISWNAMIWGYINSGYWTEALTLFKKMRIECVEVDKVSFSCLISSCAARRDLHFGKILHAQVKALGLESDVSIGTSLINMYARCSKIESARKHFDELPKQNVESWNSMIHAYIDSGLSREVLELLDDFKSQELEPDEITVLGMIMACCDTAELEQGIRVHSIVEGSEHFKESIVLQNALIDMYIKCGNTEKARAVFTNMAKKDAISWTSIIVGLAINGEGEEAIATFKQMCVNNFVPNSVTLIGVLAACDHAGLVDEGRKIYSDMHQIYHIKPQIEHCGCVVDMFARAGKIEDARAFVQEMPMEPNALIWRMLINACRVHSRINLGLSLVSGVTNIDVSHNPENLVISSNLLAEAGKWGDVASHRNFMVAHNAPKVAGKSLIS